MVNRPVFKKAVHLSGKRVTGGLRGATRFRQEPSFRSLRGRGPLLHSLRGIQAGKAREAIDGFLDLLNNAPFTTASQGKAHYFLGRSYELRKYGTLALIEYRLASLEDNGLLGKAVDKRLKELEK